MLRLDASLYFHAKILHIECSCVSNRMNLCLGFFFFRVSNIQEVLARLWLKRIQNSDKGYTHQFEAASDVMVKISCSQKNEVNARKKNVMKTIAQPNTFTVCHLVRSAAVRYFFSHPCKSMGFFLIIASPILNRSLFPIQFLSTLNILSVKYPLEKRKGWEWTRVKVKRPNVIMVRGGKIRLTTIVQMVGNRNHHNHIGTHIQIHRQLSTS